MLKGAIKNYIGCLTLLCALVSCMKLPDYDEIRYSPNENLENNIDKIVVEEKLNIDTIKIFWGNSFIIDKSYNGFNGKEKHHVASITKSIVSIIYANLYKDEYKEIFKLDFGNYVNDQKYSGMSIERLLNMQSGIKWNEIDYYDTNQMYKSDNWYNYIDNKEIDLRNKYFNYANCNYYLLMYALKMNERMKIKNFINDFFNLMEIDYIWAETPEKIEYGASGLYLTTDALMKIGYLIFSNGEWQDERLISKTYIDLLKNKNGISINSNERYCLGWYQNNNAIYAFGDGGQCIYIDYKNEIIVVTTGCVGGGSVIPRNIIPRIIKGMKIMDKPAIKNNINEELSEQKNIAGYPIENTKYIITENELEINEIEYSTEDEIIIKIHTSENELILNLINEKIEYSGELYKNFPGYLNRRFTLNVDSIIPNTMIFTLEAVDGMLDLKFELYEHKNRLILIYEEPNFGILEKVEGVKVNV